MQNKALIVNQLFKKYVEYKSNQIDEQQFWNHITKATTTFKNPITGEAVESKYYLESLLYPTKNRMIHAQGKQNYIWDADQNFFDIMLQNKELELLNNFHFEFYDYFLFSEVVFFIHTKIKKNKGPCSKAEKIIIDKILQQHSLGQYKLSDSAKIFDLLKETSENYEETQSITSVFYDTFTIAASLIPLKYSAEPKTNNNNHTTKSDIKQKNPKVKQSILSDTPDTPMVVTNAKISVKEESIDDIKDEKCNIKNTTTETTQPIVPPSPSQIALKKQLKEAQQFISIYQREIKQLKLSVKSAEENLHKSKVYWFIYGILFGATIACALFALWKSLQIISVSVYHLVQDPEPRFVIAHSDNAMHMMQGMLDTYSKGVQSTVC